MKVSNFTFEDFSSLKNRIEYEAFENEPSLLVQFFDGRNDEQLFSDLSSTLSALLPHATIIGVTTAGEILDGKMLENTVTLSFCAFTHTKLIPLYTHHCNFNGGISVVQHLSHTVKAAIFFSEGLQGKPEEFLSGVNFIRKDLTIAGGAAADYGRFARTLIALNGTVYAHGVVGVAFENASLKILNHWKLNWNPIGKPMVVTKVLNNTIFELDKTPIFEVVRHYFGDDVVAHLPSSIVKFPLIKTEKGVYIARAPVAVTENALVFGGNFNTGDRVRFGIANVDEIVENNDARLLLKPEVVWIYSCMGRKAFAGEILESEFLTYNILGTTCGFFSYGEFFKTSRSSQMMNLTTTVLALSEQEELETLPQPSRKQLDEKHENIAVMSRLTNAVVDELEHTIKTLDAYKLALDANSIVSKTNTQGIITYVNDLFVKISGYSREELIGKSHNIIRHPDVPNGTFKDMWTTIKKGHVWKGLIINKAKSGEPYYVDTTIIPLFDENKQIVEYISTRNDLTKIIKQQKQILKQTTDALTNLPNRVKLFEDIAVSQNPIIALINIDGFGEINRFYGFESGNTLLREFSALFLEMLNLTPYSLYKLEADNFVIFGDGEDNELFCTTMEKFINQVHTHQFLADMQGITTRISVGIAVEKEQILSHAEEALKQARLRNMDWMLSDKKEEAIHLQNFQMLHTLKSALEHDRIVPYYQALVHLKSHKITKYESLMRLIDENGKVYTPYFFLEVAKKSKYYLALTRIMIEKTLLDFTHREENVAINLSVEDIEDAETVLFIKNAIKNFVEPSRITFELTETEAIKDYLTIISFIASVKELGVKIAIDDFGSGYSNFAYLAQFNANILKIDGTIIQKITTDSSAYQIAAAINDFAKRLGLQTVAEFVFDEATNDVVKDLNIDFAQGYFHAEPLPIEKLP
ncbi:sensor domain-containing phosphodiesterase [Sulfurospirillum diekertiae]|uniref:sensor domain-containing phosphodiesterase n=1 Tax=Sulfurospirillum diekertiae TaxID=1854492 RepID=UPI000B4D4E96|nr:EAL domain-containing protein [Sulfurospirillum diekertiae]ASC94196.1 Cyclic di-GMP phosphodiesterase CdpA [Sulfurospirillum diekertiae]